MGFMDKAREAAQQATTKAQQGLAQGQAKFDEVQTSRAADALLRDLGTACYAEQRGGGSAEAVVAALSALDAHVAANGPLGQAGPGSSQASPQSSPQPGTAAGPPSATSAPSSGAQDAPPTSSPIVQPAQPPTFGGSNRDDV